MNSRLVEFKRQLNIDLPNNKSAFLWGPRKSGKTTYLTERFPKSLVYDLLETDLFLRLSREPSQLREELLAKEASLASNQPIIIDEVQKIPPLLDEVHWLIEKKKLSFILCGSSARKLRRSHANMLGGRAWRFQLHPLTTRELGKHFDLLKALNRGLIPSHYLADQASREIHAYIQDYIREEIQQEGLVRNLPAFARFLDSVPFNNGQMINYAKMSNDCGVDPKTIAEYFQILVDTMMGYFLEPYRKQRKRQIITATPKFYFFDVGVVGGLTQRKISINKGEEFGKAFEHFILMELMAHSSYSELHYPIRYWRTKDGHEVDFILHQDGEIAIEVKSTSNVNSDDLKGLKVYMEEHKPKQAILVCQEKRARKLESGIEILPWGQFLERLWQNSFLAKKL